VVGEHWKTTIFHNTSRFLITSVGGGDLWITHKAMEKGNCGVLLKGVPCNSSLSFLSGNEKCEYDREYQNWRGRQIVRNGTIVNPILGISRNSGGLII